MEILANELVSYFSFFVFLKLTMLDTIDIDVMMICVEGDSLISHGFPLSIAILPRTG